jgi:hypothetical protein
MTTIDRVRTQPLELRPGELVRVRSASEIFATLDEDGTLDGVPFMPEMVRFCGRTLTVFKRADKTCDAKMRLRRMEDAVHLSGVRCDGSAHGGCQAACLMYWKEAWLERVDEPVADRPAPGIEPYEQAYVAETLEPATTRGEDADGRTIFRCQATDVEKGSAPIGPLALDQYPRDVRNWSVGKVAKGLLVELFNLFQRCNRRLLPKVLLIGGARAWPFLTGSLERGETPTGRLDLQPGELVRVKSYAEIMETLDTRQFNRGLSFDVEMVPYCGRTARVLCRVGRIIDENDGKMIELKSDCIILEGVVCRGDFHRFCTRSIYPYWREIWLERVA